MPKTNQTRNFEKEKVEQLLSFMFSQFFGDTVDIKHLTG